MAAEQPFDQIEELFVVADFFAEPVVQVPAIEPVRRRGQQQYGRPPEAGSYHLVGDAGAPAAAGQQVLKTLEFIEDHQIGSERVEPRLRQSDAQEFDGLKGIFISFAPYSGQELASLQPELVTENAEERTPHGCTGLASPPILPTLPARPGVPPQPLALTANPRQERISGGSEQVVEQRPFPYRAGSTLSPAVGDTRVGSQRVEVQRDVVRQHPIRSEREAIDVAGRTAADLWIR